MENLESQLDFSTDQVAHQPGGSLVEYAAHLHENDETVVLTSSDRQLWYCDSANALLRLPLDCYEPVPAETVKTLLRQKSIWMLSYLTKSTKPSETNSIHYKKTLQKQELFHRAA